jgi:N-acetylglucosamine-6-phosphate deacetylase
MVIWSDRVLIEGRLTEATISVEGSTIKDVTPGKCPKGTTLDFSGYRVIPGLIDTHIHGCAGADTMDATYDALNTMSKYLASHGVTSFLPTTVTASEDCIRSALANVAETIKSGCEGAKILGSYVEGPFLTSEYRGAHQGEYLQDISIELIERILVGSRGTVLNIAVAPEQPQALEAIRYLCSMDINVSLGHSSADYEQTMHAIKAGAKRIVHIYNGMAPMHHREPGLLGAALLSSAYAEIICDGYHIAPPAVEVALRCKGPDKIVLVSDCMRAGGLPDGIYTLGSSPVEVKSGIARLMDGGTLAGSTLSLDVALAKYIEMTGEPFERAVLAVTENPARSLGVYHKIGSIEPGKCADIIALDNCYKPVFVMVDGDIKLD